MYISPLGTYRINGHFECVHGSIPDFVISCIYKDLIKDLIQPRWDGDRLVGHFLAIMHPHRLLLLLGAANVGIRPEQDVFQLSLLLVYLLDRLPFLFIVHGASTKRLGSCFIGLLGFRLWTAATG